jgi:hypothetical protein
MYILYLLLFLSSVSGAQEVLPFDIALNFQHWLENQHRPIVSSPTFGQQQKYLQIGQVLSCQGTCKLFRGLGAHSLRSGSRLETGDEIKTWPDSYLWIYLEGGTLVRLAPLTSLSFTETFKLSDTFVFVARLNAGMIYWLVREATKKDESLAELNETDPLFLPVTHERANLEYWARKKIQTSSEDERRSWVAEKPYRLGALEQLQELNRLIDMNNATQKIKKVQLLLTTANMTVESDQKSFMLFYGPGDKSLLKARRDEDQSTTSQLSVSFRGYENEKTQTILDENWWECDADGKVLSPLAASSAVLFLSELFWKRITTLELMREFLLQEAHESNGAQVLKILPAKKAWPLLTDEEWQKQKPALITSLRRQETTTLRSLQKLVGQLKDEPLMPKKNFSSLHMAHAHETYIQSLKVKMPFSTIATRDMKNYHFWAWRLRQSKQNF